MVRFILNAGIWLGIIIVGPFASGAILITLNHAFGLPVDVYDISRYSQGVAGGFAAGFVLWGWH